MENNLKEIKCDLEKDTDLCISWQFKIEWLIEQVERLKKENLQLRCYKEAYEKTYHQLVEMEGNYAARTKADL